jgi:hypothetical protein
VPKLIPPIAVNEVLSSLKRQPSTTSLSKVVAADADLSHRADEIVSHRNQARGCMSLGNRAGLAGSR